MSLRYALVSDVGSLRERNEDSARAIHDWVLDNIDESGSLSDEPAMVLTRRAGRRLLVLTLARRSQEQQSRQRRLGANPSHRRTRIHPSLPL